MAFITTKSPMGIKMPLFAYAASVALLITAGSSLAMYKIQIPWWAWVFEFAILFVICFQIAKRNYKYEGSGSYVVVKKTKLIVFSLVAAAIIATLVLLIW